MHTRSNHIEWPTVAVIAACTGVWMASTWAAGHDGLWPLLAVATVCVTLHSSCQHEVLHGHPTRNRLVNEALVFIAPGLFFPFRRFKALHLQHHNDPNLTDPYEDPETNYMAKEAWDRMPWPMQRLRDINNTLAGRLILGPAIGVIGFWAADARRMIAGDQRVMVAWGLHLVGLAITLWWITAVAGLSLWTYAFTVAYPGFSLLTIRTFLEHRAEAEVPHRTCIVEDNTGIFSFLFLNNNLHVVHHMRPAAAWYDLPKLYREGRDRYLTINGGYLFTSYWQMARQYLLHAKSAVPHPFLPGKDHG